MQRIVGVQQSNDDVGIENDLSHRRVRWCRLRHQLARRARRRPRHVSSATTQPRAASAGALRALQPQPPHAARSRRDLRARAPSHHALRVLVERPRTKDCPISSSENQLRPNGDGSKNSRLALPNPAKRPEPLPPSYLNSLEYPSILEAISRLPAGAGNEVTERWLRPIARLPHDEQLTAVAERLDLSLEEDCG